MVSIIKSSAPLGLNGIPIEIECDLSNGLPGITVVGLGAKAVDEAKERVKSALLNSGLQLPRRRITINLSPADIPKDGSSYDLAIAISVLRASEQINLLLEDSAFIGELSLDGRIQAVPAILVHVQSAANQGLKRIFVPAENSAQASLVSNIDVIPVQTLKELYRGLNEVKARNFKVLKPSNISRQQLEPTIDLADISGQDMAKRAIEIAAAGHHNLLMTGPPGTGKTMLASALPSILPPLTREEIIEVTNLHSLHGQHRSQVTINRPFRSPHHTASQISIIGGGHQALPGEISLAHTGVLFMDELPEYPRSVTEALRQPLEDKVVTIARANRRVKYPANFMLVATQNPCPCGYYGDEKRECVCTPHQINQYQKRLSGPLLDRIDLVVPVERIEGKELINGQGRETSQQVQSRVVSARRISSRRNPQGLANASLTGRHIKKHLPINSEVSELLETAINRLDLSPRAAWRSVRVARTIADLDASEQIETRHLSEALQYRLRESVLI